MIRIALKHPSEETFAAPEGKWVSEPGLGLLFEDVSDAVDYVRARRLRGVRPMVLLLLPADQGDGSEGEE